MLFLSFSLPPLPQLRSKPNVKVGFQEQCYGHSFARKNKLIPLLASACISGNYVLQKIFKRIYSSSFQYKLIDKR